jgi:hypothetical protein
MLKELHVMETLTAVHALALTAGLVSARQSSKINRSRSLATEGEIVFEVTQSADGYFLARSQAGGIVTRAATWDSLRGNIRSVLKTLYFERAKDCRVRLHVVRDERVVLAPG